MTTMAHHGCVMTSDGPRRDAQLSLPLQIDEPSEAAANSHLCTTTPDDAAARAGALDTAHSFIVRAPAGSGKTELLTQRVLALLALADAPEEVVAITFTRKAAAEMKDRLLEALAQAVRGDARKQQKPHHALTLHLAQQVAARDRELDWQLAANPARLRVQTIDALALWLARQLPITTRFAAITQVTERAEPLYAAAAHATLSLVDGDGTQTAEQTHVARLLTHLDNDWSRAHRLLGGMLARRDQWLRHVGHLDRAALEAPMQNECSRQIERVCEALLGVDAEELIALARYAAGNLLNDSHLSPCADLDRLPEASFTRLDVWRALAAMLLTKDGSWRTRFSKLEGFPSTAAGPFKQRIAALMDAMRSNERLRLALHGLRDLPAPHFTPSQWEVLEAIVALLPRAAAELMLAFGDAGESDFVQVTHAAVHALGDTLDMDEAGDAAHSIDARIRHLLIDEFQDTSITQSELIERLVADWGTGDGRTVFIVGDPMQSIYRFREAEVGLFLRAWNSGIGRLPLQRLQLTRNFRSQRRLVEWVNAAFGRVMPGESDIASGSVAFEPSVAEEWREGEPPEAATFNALIDGSPYDEAARVIKLVQRIQANDPASSIALLVRARPHLAQIVPALREARLQFTAVEIEPLLARPLIGDLLALTRALEHRADKIAWLAVLRAPWCGLTLADLSALVEGSNHTTVWQQMCDSSRWSQLSADAQRRLTRVAGVLARALELHGRSALTERLRQTWWLLGGPACVSSASDHADAESFFDHLAEHEERSGVTDIAAFEASLVRLYAASDAHAGRALQLMTIHKAKGLEFDYVIVPGLDRVPASDDAQLMQWLERPSDVSPAELLLSPIYAADTDKKTDSIYCWIERLQQQRQMHEDERLLYVAATRARKQLHWLACLPTTDGELSAPRVNSLLQRLWPAVEDDCKLALAERAEAGGGTAAVLPATYDQSLRRLAVDWAFPTAPPALKWQHDVLPPAEPAIEFSWASETARRVGSVVHRWLQRIGDDALRDWSAERVQAITPHIERELAGAGIGGTELKAARARVAQALNGVLSDPRARWLLGPHNDAQSELRLTMRTESGAKRIVLDRTFVDENGARWIIDYKTGTHEGADVEGFLDREQLRYAAQLQLYAQAFGGNAQLGLYFPLLNGWRGWKS
ncbi:MAG TPA: UvrD-helicase domain-containing protein [Burkholderiaceae bacterium]|nr:UvrD-helicase domain-containing protein [Burkholderiaceae bacterium]